MDSIICKDDGRVVSFFKTVDSLEKELDYLTDNYLPLLNGERFITDKELSEILKISRRTLQDYRDKGLINSYYLRGKIIYKESDIHKTVSH